MMIKWSMNNAYAELYVTIEKTKWRRSKLRSFLSKNNNIKSEIKKHPTYAVVVSDLDEVVKVKEVRVA